MKRLKRNRRICFKYKVIMCFPYSWRLYNDNVCAAASSCNCFADNRFY